MSGIYTLKPQRLYVIYKITVFSMHVLCRWLDQNEDDGRIGRELVPLSDGQRLYSKLEKLVLHLLKPPNVDTYIQCVCVCAIDIGYHIAVKTGNIPGGSSDSTVFVKLYGEKGDTSKMMLVVSDNDLGNYFETGRIDIFTVETFDIGQVRCRGVLI